ncbi:MAG TPA: BadF/BadG/BcrA/BcrD ATPase family protein, partial [Candidatus Krumholzibacterium sp.]|nr:BadF/BadG/BcrA/BcrD ATPase family protein [Candidatus Krumholzibacterium sp.]
MDIFLGIDAGTVSFKWVLAGPAERLRELSMLGDGLIDRVSTLPDGTGIAWSRYSRVQGTPLQAARADLSRLLAITARDEIVSAAITGASSVLISEALGIPRESGFRATAAAASLLHPGIENVFEMGGENSSYIRLSDNGGHRGIAGYETNGDCAAGTGSFLDQQASRLRYRVEDIGEVALMADRSPRIAGRCSVFAKSDMIHAQQKGYRPEEILKGLCEAVARNFKSTITRGRSIEGRCLFVGGVAMNDGVVSAMTEVFGLSPGELVVPERCAWTGALGTALLAAASGRALDHTRLSSGLSGAGEQGNSSLPAWTRLSPEKVNFL